MFALNCALQIEQANFENDDSEYNPVAMVLRSLRFLSASQILFASQSSAPFLIRQRHFSRSRAICPQDTGGMLNSFRDTFMVSL